jgi:hypothetical protein
MPALGHVWVIVLENRGFEQVVGSPDAPYLNGLIEQHGLAEAFHAVARPSQPNYLALFSGSTHGVTDNEPHHIDAPTLADQIEASGRTWRQHSENVPGDCYDGRQASGGRDGAGDYRRKHAPAITFTSIRTDPIRCASIQDLTAFRPGASDFAFIVPNECHNGHDCGLDRVDAWLAGFVPRILESEAFATDGVLFVTYDEAQPGDPGGGHIMTLVVSPMVPAGYRSRVPHDHYSLLRTIQDGWGLPCLAESCTANTLTEFFTAR